MQTTDKVKILELLERTDSIRRGHFELSSGLHSSQYFQCAKLLQYPDIAGEVGSRLAQLFDMEIDLVVGPALGGIIIAHEVGRALNKRTIFAERKDGTLCIRRGFEISKGERIIILEDVITTAKSAKETAEIIKEWGGEIVGYGCIVDRSEGKTGLNIKSLLQMTPEVYDPSACPLCKQGSKAEKPGSRTTTRP
ncbi:MAG: orotate phosphoribosyltransferase [Candidatus Melainabacteria bacterium RIFOXYA12_FULL_32_12]|nr:MAG: orotate phosphoribosyltransferase [Candidatus Melainabacteria bacterium RIFOXYA2_FULL_32_9]OGI30176.1 MAG: orotate phosphoribosyltransferase [Candidatus Melainabacteria bacterium RIFOXYA12_FULL_32_12]